MPRTKENSLQSEKSGGSFGASGREFFLVNRFKKISLFHSLIFSSSNKKDKKILIEYHSSLSKKKRLPFLIFFKTALFLLQEKLLFGDYQFLCFDKLSITESYHINACGKMSYVNSFLIRFPLFNFSVIDIDNKFSSHIIHFNA